jgi:hypothetical protein
MMTPGMEALDHSGVPAPGPWVEVALLLLTGGAVWHAWKHAAGAGFLGWLVVILGLPVVGPMAAWLCLPSTKRWSMADGPKGRPKRVGPEPE